MKMLQGNLLQMFFIVFLGVLHCTLGLRVEPKKTPLLSSMPEEGLPCDLGYKTVCHRDISVRLTSTLAKICNNGKIQNTTIPPNYFSKRDRKMKCTFEGKEFCEGDHIPNPSKWWVQHTCLKGEVVLKTEVSRV